MQLSIITVNLNNLAGLSATMQSVYNQSFCDYEYIVIDGGSTDGSKEYIEQHSDRLAYWVSERDFGVYEAMNKGIARALGGHILFLNSGDFLATSQVLSKVFSEPMTADIVYGNIFWETDGQLTEGLFPDTLTFQYFKNASLPHQATFIRRSLFNSIGMYDGNYPIIADWKFFLHAIFRYNVSCKAVDVVISVCNRHGLSCEADNWPKIVADRIKVINEDFKRFDEELESLHKMVLDLRKENIQIRSSFGYRLHKKVRRLYSRKR